jgi:hypothetical protein
MSAVAEVMLASRNVSGIFFENGVTTNLPLPSLSITQTSLLLAEFEPITASGDSLTCPCVCMCVA